MNRKVFLFAVVLLWMAVPLVGLEYWRAWDRLPAQVATHFNAAGEANGWMSREVAVEFGLGIMVCVLAVFTPLLWLAARHEVTLASWSLLALCAVILGFMAEGNRAILRHSLVGGDVKPELALIALPVAIVLVAAVFAGSGRGQPLPTGDVVAEETHAGRVWSLIILPAMIGPVVGTILAPTAATRAAVVVVGIVGLATIAMTWGGFQYRFLTHGVEVRMLGFRLRSIPRNTIQSYAIEPWSMLRGYGIRGVGRTRAYVWCNQVVHIKTSNGDVFLGHSDPERIVRDLDAVTGLVSRG